MTRDRPQQDSGWLSVRGGAGGTAVGLDDLDAAAAVLAGCAEDLAVVGARVALTQLDPDLLASAVVSPATAAQARLLLASLAGPLGVPGDSALTSSLALGVRAATAAYREVDAGVASSISLYQDAVMAMVGRALVLSPGALAGGAVAAHLAGVDLAGSLDHTVYEHPALADLAGGVDGLLVGVGGVVAGWALPLLVLGADVQRAGRAGRDSAAYGADPGTNEVALRLVDGLAALLGMLCETSAVRVMAEPQPRRGAAPPRSLAALATDLENLSNGEHYPGRVRVTEVLGPQGPAWVVEISGTQEWDPRAGPNASDVTTDVRLMAQQSTALARGVETALDQAQGATGRDTAAEPVLLAGHSQGGIAAAALAATPQFTARHRVTHVVTMGSPVARMPVPPEVQVLSLEHRQDAVPRLEGATNPDRRGWVTVTRDLAGDTDSLGTASGAHATREYVETAAAADETDDPSLAAWREGSARFFAGDGRVGDYRVERVAPGG